MAYDFSKPELPALGWLSSLRGDDRRLFSSYGEFLPAPPESPIITQGEPQPYLYFVLNGQFDIYILKDEEQVKVASLQVGDSIGEMGIFDLAPASATVQPVVFSQMWRIDYENFMKFSDENPVAAIKIYNALLTTMAQRLRKK